MSAADSKQATIQREADFAATREAVLRGLAAHNEARVGPRNTQPLALSLRDESGAMVGGLVLGLCESFATGYISSAYEDALAFALLVLILIFRPAGILGQPEVQKV